MYKTRKDYNNKRFGSYLTISLKSIKQDKRYRVYYTCICDCGETIDIRADRLIKIQKCICNIGNSEITDKKSGYQARIKNKNLFHRSIYYFYKRSATERGYKFELEYEYFKELILGDCFYCNIQPSNGKDFKYSGIDRMDNKKGYDKSNCVPCCKICNMAKRDMPYDDFIGYIKRLSNNVINKKFS